MKFWNWGPIIISHRLRCSQFFSSKITPPYCSLYSILSLSCWQWIEPDCKVQKALLLSMVCTPWGEWLRERPWMQYQLSQLKERIYWKWHGIPPVPHKYWIRDQSKVVAEKIQFCKYIQRDGPKKVIYSTYNNLMHRSMRQAWIWIWNF